MSLTHDSSNIVLTPLSSEACLKHGINPEALRQRTFDSFWEKNISVEIQRIRYESYEKRRHDLMAVAVEEKNNLIKKSAQSNDECESYSDTLSQSLTPSIMLANEEREKSAILDMETRRLEKAKAKQKRELLQMLQFERKMGQAQTERRAKAEREALLEEKKRRDKIMKERRAAEEKRVKELRRKAQEDAEEEMHKLAAREQYEKERKIRKLKETEQIKAKKKLQLLEQEREKKREAHRLKTEKFQADQRRLAEIKMKEREQKEFEFQEKKALKKAMDLKELEAKRQQSSQRIQENKITAQKIEEQRKVRTAHHFVSGEIFFFISFHGIIDHLYSHFEINNRFNVMPKNTLIQKQIQCEKLQKELNSKREEERFQKQREREMIARKRDYQLKMSKEKEEEMKEGFRRKFEAGEKHVRTLRRERQQQQVLVKEEKEVKMELKRDNVERIKRIREYRRLETMRKLNENSKRTDELLQKKKDLLNQRRKAAHEAKVQKDMLMQKLEKTKSCSGKAIQKLLVELDMNDSKKKTSMAKKTVRKKSRSMTNIKGPPTMIEIGPPPDVPSLFTKSEENEIKEPFKSPYLPSH